MKSQAYASKRRLTNICCLVVGLGLVKLVFGAYLIAGGTLFTLPKKEKVVDPRMEALAKVREKQLLAMKKMDKEIVVDKTQTEQNISLQKIDTKAQNTHSQKLDNNLVAEASKNRPEQVLEDEMNETMDDEMLVKASMNTIGTIRTKARQSVLENSFSGKEDKELLEGMDKKPTYKQENSRSLFSLVGTAHAEEVDAKDYVRLDQQKAQAEMPAPNIETPYDSPKILSYKESELNQKEEELLSLQEQMNARMKELNSLENKLGTMVKEANSVESEKYTHLIQTYASMKPKRAAQALSTLDEKIAVRILNGLKSKQSGEIFSYMDPVQAARLSQAMTKLQAL